MRAFKSVSPSQFNTFNDCKRQWWFQSILGLPTPQRASAALGTAVHEQLEAYVDSGKIPANTEAGRIAKAGLSLLPEPGTSWTEVKMHNEDTQAQWPRIYLAGLPVNGYVDLLNLTGKRPLILDHKCLPASAVVHTDKGPRRVGDLWTKWTCAAWEIQSGMFVPVVASAPMDAGVQRVFRIRLKNGMDGRYGETHPLWTQRGWVAASDVQPSDTVAVALGLPDTEGIPVPDALIKVTAMLLCDGALTTKTLTYTKTGAARADYMRCLSELGVPFSERGLSRPGRAPYVQVSAAALSPLREMLHGLGLEFVGSSERCVPPLLMGMNKRQIGIFLGGLWSGDGAAYIVHADGKQKPVVTFAGRSRRLCEGVRDLLLRIGIPATLTTSSVAYNNQRVPYHAATVVGKQGKLDFLNRAISGEIEVADRCSGRLTRAKKVPPSLHEVLQAAEATADHPAGQFPIRTDGPLWWVPVSEVLLDGAEPCFDIEVPFLHTFVAEGVVTHNTTSDLKYAKKKDELLCDPQMVIYGSFALAACDAQGIEATEVDAGHVVYLTRGAPSARKTLVTLDRKHLAAERQKLEVTVNEMKGFAEATSPDKVPGEPSSCNKYGGCHFRDKCRALSLIDDQPMTFAGYFREPSQPATTTPSENLMSTIDPLAALAAIKARKAAEAAGAPPAVVAPPAPVATTVVTEVATEVVAEVATEVVAEVAVSDSQDAARAALLAKYGIKKPSVSTFAAETPVSIVPPDAPPQVKPSAFTKPAEVAPAAPVAEPEDKKAVRKPKNYAEKLAALNWNEAQIGRMTPESMREALDGNLDGSRYSVLKDGAILLPAPVVENDPMPYVAEEDNDVSLPEVVTESVIEKPQPAPAPVEAPPAPSLVLYIDCAPEKGRDRTYITLEDYIQPLCAEAVAIHNRGAKDAERVDFYGLIPYNRGPTYIAAMLLKSPPTGVIVCNTRYPATNACLEVLAPFADVIVRASR